MSLVTNTAQVSLLSGESSGMPSALYRRAGITNDNIAVLTLRLLVLNFCFI
nr:MAG TPA_asm: hypothetical protein [Caudoviricetes sp.]